jgi:hypothetical protein
MVAKPRIMRTIIANGGSLQRVTSGVLGNLAFAAAILAVWLQLCSPAVAGTEEAPARATPQIWLGTVPFSIGELSGPEFSVGMDFASRGPGFGVGAIYLNLSTFNGKIDGYIIGVNGVFNLRGADKYFRPRLLAGLLFAVPDGSDENPLRNTFGWQVGGAIEIGSPRSIHTPLVIEVFYRGLEFENDLKATWSADNLSRTGFQVNIGFKFHTLSK